MDQVPYHQVNSSTNENHLILSHWTTESTCWNSRYIFQISRILTLIPCPAEPRFGKFANLVSNFSRNIKDIEMLNFKPARNNNKFRICQLFIKMIRTLSTEDIFNSFVTRSFYQWRVRYGSFKFSYVWVIPGSV